MFCVCRNSVFLTSVSELLIVFQNAHFSILQFLFVYGKLCFFYSSNGLLQIEMLEYRKKRLELEPVSAVTWNSLSSSGRELGSLEFRRVICEGVFDERKSIYVGPRSRSISGVTENGYYLVTPLVPITDNPER